MNSTEVQLAPPPQKPCPKCSRPANALLFLGVQPDGWVCEHCRVWFHDDGALIAGVVIY